MALIINNILCEEIGRKDGLKEEIDIIRGPTARKGYLVEWDLRYQVASGLLGYTTGTLFNNISLVLPQKYPEINGIYANHITIEPVGSPSQGINQIQWPYCIIWTEYSRLPWLANPINELDQNTPILFATQRVSLSSEYVTIPGMNLKFASSGNSLTDQNYAFRMALMEYSLEYKQMPLLIDWTAMGKYIGTTNEHMFLNVPPGQVLFNGMTTEPTCTYNGTYTQDVAYSFTIRTVPWDYSYDSKAQVWDQVVGVASGNPVINRTDWTNILPNYIVIGGG